MRHHLRARRRQLSPRQQQLAAIRLARTLNRQQTICKARHVAVYLPNDGEIDPSVFVRQARKRGVRFYLPVLHPVHPGQLTFQPWQPDTRLRPNRFGIPEPRFRSNRVRPPWTLDLVLLPLVGFDTEGGRLGMGGGFYDRTFAFIRQRPCPAPQLLGLAHDIQKVEKLPVESWDIPLDGIATDCRFYRARRLADPKRTGAATEEG